MSASFTLVNGIKVRLFSHCPQHKYSIIVTFISFPSGLFSSCILIRLYAWHFRICLFSTKSIRQFSFFFFRTVGLMHFNTLKGLLFQDLSFVRPSLSFSFFFFRTVGLMQLNTLKACYFYLFSVSLSLQPSEIGCSLCIQRITSFRLLRNYKSFDSDFVAAVKHLPQY